jgi:uncharacterized protein (DUF427 family)
MARAEWNGVVIARSDSFEEVEGNIYFPPDAIDRQYFRPSDQTTVCPWKGTAHYYDIMVAGAVNRAAAWYYPQPKPAAAKIKDHVAFWRGVTVER